MKQGKEEKDKNGAAKKAEVRKRAEELVKKFEELRNQYYEELDEAKKQYPDAAALFDQVNELKADAEKVATSAKPLLAELGESIGDFKVTPKKTTPGYNEEKVLIVLCSLDDDNLGEVFKHMASAGVIKSVAIDKVAANAYFPLNKEIEDGFATAFDSGGTPLTPAVSLPKV